MKARNNIMAQLIKDTLPLMEVVNKDMAKAARNHGIPLFKGVLFKHQGGLDQNLDKYGRPIFNFVNENTVVLGGALLALKKLFYDKFDYTSGSAETPQGGDAGKDYIKFMPGTLNDKFHINNNIAYADTDTKICLFGCGTGGASTEWGSVYDPDFKTWNLGEMAIDNTYGVNLANTWIPFRVSPDETISPDETGNVPTNYFFRTPVNLSAGSGTGYAWYLKEFTNHKQVPIKALWQDTLDPSDDGSEIRTDSLSEEQMRRTDLIECFGECMLTITEDDLREFYIAAGNLGQAKFNQIGLFTGVKKEVDPANHRFDYVGVRLFSVVNFNNVSLQEPSTNVYLYRIYSAV
jgi:hypothetical protein